MINENQVITAVITYLQMNNWQIAAYANTTTHGFDIIATKNNHRLFIEAKGDTSSKKGSKRYKKGFSSNQIKDHFSVALYWLLRNMADKGKNDEFGIALPNTKRHVNLINSIGNIPKLLHFHFYLVHPSDRSVRII